MSTLAISLKAASCSTVRFSAESRSAGFIDASGLPRKESLRRHVLARCPPGRSNIIPMPGSPPPLVLASASPRRQASAPRAARPSAFAVDPGRGRRIVPARESHRRPTSSGLAQEKARAWSRSVTREAWCSPPTPPSCSTARILGKPADADEALRMLSALAGRTHRVLTAVATAGRRHAVHTVETEVTFAPASREAPHLVRRDRRAAGQGRRLRRPGHGRAFLVERVDRQPLQRHRAAPGGDGGAAPGRRRDSLPWEVR